jgi:hypothetical protein
MKKLIGITAILIIGVAGIANANTEYIFDSNGNLKEIKVNGVITDTFIETRRGWIHYGKKELLERERAIEEQKERSIREQKEIAIGERKEIAIGERKERKVKNDNQCVDDPFTPPIGWIPTILLSLCFLGLIIWGIWNIPVGQIKAMEDDN